MKITSTRSELQAYLIELQVNIAETEQSMVQVIGRRDGRTVGI